MRSMTDEGLMVAEIALIIECISINHMSITPTRSSAGPHSGATSPLQKRKNVTLLLDATPPQIIVQRAHQFAL
jgi:hypothetical protein